MCLCFFSLKKNLSLVGIEIGKMSHSQYKIKRGKKRHRAGHFSLFEKTILFWEKMNDENNKIKKLLSDLPIRNKSNFSKAPPHDGANEGHQKSANMTVRQTADRSHDYDVMEQFFLCQKWSFYFRKYLKKEILFCVGTNLGVYIQ